MIEFALFFREEKEEDIGSHRNDGRIKVRWSSGGGRAYSLRIDLSAYWWWISMTTQRLQWAPSILSTLTELSTTPRTDCSFACCSHFRLWALMSEHNQGNYCINLEANESLVRIAINNIGMAMRWHVESHSMERTRGEWLVWREQSQVLPLNHTRPMSAHILSTPNAIDCGQANRGHRGTPHSNHRSISLDFNNNKRWMVNSKLDWMNELHANR